jgi:hypothetical protein
MEMPTIGEFAKKWHMVKWTLGSHPGRIPSHGFKNNGTISLTQVDGTPACDISWTDANENPCSIKALPFHEANGTLQASDITVQFSTPTGGENPVPLGVILRIEQNKLIGILGPPRGIQDANTGTFIADANPPEPGEEKRQKPGAEAHAHT